MPGCMGVRLSDNLIKSMPHETKRDYTKIIQLSQDMLTSVMVCLGHSRHQLVHCYCCLNWQGEQDVQRLAIDFWECFIQEPAAHICGHHVRQGKVGWHGVCVGHWTENNNLDSGENVYSKILVGVTMAMCSNAITHAAMGQCSPSHLWLTIFLNAVDQRCAYVRQ